MVFPFKNCIIEWAFPWSNSIYEIVEKPFLHGMLFFWGMKPNKPKGLEWKEMPRSQIFIWKKQEDTRVKNKMKVTVDSFTELNSFKVRLSQGSGKVPVVTQLVLRSQGAQTWETGSLMPIQPYSRDGPGGWWKNPSPRGRRTYVHRLAKTH